MVPRNTTLISSTFFAKKCGYSSKGVKKTLYIIFLSVGQVFIFRWGKVVSRTDFSMHSVFVRDAAVWVGVGLPGNRARYLPSVH